MHGLDILTQLFLLCVSIGTVALLWARVIAPMLHAFGVRHPLLYILHAEPDNQAPQRDYVQPDAPQPEQTDRQTQTDGLSAAPHWLQMDGSDIRQLNIPPGSRALLIEALVIEGWRVGQIRARIKGDNNVISEEVAAARAKHDIRGRTITVTESGKAREIEL